MSKEKEVIAYAITHAGFDAKGKAIKGGPYAAMVYADTKATTPDLAKAWRCDVYPLRRSHPSATPTPVGPAQAHAYANDLRNHGCTVRVIRIVRARPSEPSEASAVEVLREMVAWDDQPRGGGIRPFAPIIDHARCVLAAAGPDPMLVVRAAMRETEAERVFNRAIVTGRSAGAEVDDLIAAREELAEAVGKYTKAGGK